MVSITHYIHRFPLKDIKEVKKVQFINIHSNASKERNEIRVCRSQLPIIFVLICHYHFGGKYFEIIPNVLQRHLIRVFGNKKVPSSLRIYRVTYLIFPHLTEELKSYA